MLTEDALRSTKLVCLLALLAAGCLSSESGFADTDGNTVEGCELDVSLMGGYIGTLDVNGCGADAQQSLNFTDGDSYEGAGVTVTFALVEAAEAEYTGPVEFGVVSVRVQHSAGHVQEWETASGACNGEFTSNVFAPKSIIEDRYLIGGKGQCESAAQPIGDNDSEPVEIGEFSFTGQMAFLEGPHRDGETASE